MRVRKGTAIALIIAAITLVGQAQECPVTSAVATHQLLPRVKGLCGNGERERFIVPANINSVFLAANTWVHGKLRFAQSGAGHVRRIYGPGVLDVSRFGEHRYCGLEPLTK